MYEYLLQFVINEYSSSMERFRFPESLHSLSLHPQTDNTHASADSRSDANLFLASLRRFCRFVAGDMRPALLSPCTRFSCTSGEEWQGRDGTGREETGDRGQG